MSDRPDVPLVWVVDDSPLERAVTVKALGSEYRCVELGDGSEVVERLSTGAERPDLILLDWVMPGMSGDEVCRFIRANPAYAELSIIMFTASRIETDDVVRGLALGANDYVPKPFAPEELRARLLSVLRTKEHREAAARERTRLAAINGLGRALFHAGADVGRILRELVTSLHGLVADGCAIILLPGEFPPISLAVHRTERDASTLASIATLADPTVHAFASSDEALAKLPPLYHPYIRRFGLRGLAILPFPIRNPVQGVVTLTRDGASKPFDEDDISAIETCIEYASLAVQSSLRFEAERNAVARLTAVLEHAPVGIVVAGAEGNVELVNPTARRLLPGVEGARTLDAVYSLGRWSTTAGAPISRDQWPIGASAETAHREELVLTCDDRTPSVLAVTTVSRRDVDALSGTVTAIEDVTALHVITKERERIAGFQEQMLGIVGHDLRNPLSAITMATELIAEMSKDTPKVQSVIARMQSSSKRMTSIVNQLLDATRTRLGEGIPLARTELDLAVLVRTLVEELRTVHTKTRFEVVGESTVGAWDPDRLGQVISNLASNAAHYGDPAKPVRLTVATEGDRAVLEVWNAILGAPIPPERLATLFDPFRRGEHSAIAHRSGLGLGLYIAHEIVRAHKGELTARSSEAGTVFRVELPLRGTRS